MSIEAVLANPETAMVYWHQTGVTQKNHKYQRRTPEQDLNPEPQKYEWLKIAGTLCMVIDTTNWYEQQHDW